MKWIIALLATFLIASIAFAQTLETVMTPADVEIRFSGETAWVNGADTQTVFSVDSIAYSAEPLSTDIKHTTKLNVPENWQVEMWRLPGEPFRKAIFIVTIYEATHRIFELRVRNRYAGEDVAGDWSLPIEDKVIGKPGKAVNTK